VDNGVYQFLQGSVNTGYLNVPSLDQLEGTRDASGNFTPMDITNKDGQVVGSATYVPEGSGSGSEPRMDEGAVTDESGGLLLAAAGASGVYKAIRALSSALIAANGPPLVPPAYANTPGGFVNWLKNLQHAGTQLTSSQADAIAAQAKQLGVEVRLDPPHPGTYWDVPHLNIGKEGQVHLEVPEGYSNPTIPQGSAGRP
jgi:hypothetical protein